MKKEKGIKRRKRKGRIRRKKEILDFLKLMHT